MQVGNILCLERGDFGHGVWVVPQLASAEANCSKLLRELCLKAHSAGFAPLGSLLHLQTFLLPIKISPNCSNGVYRVEHRGWVQAEFYADDYS